jgi:gliding motility-associated-like protein
MYGGDNIVGDAKLFELEDKTPILIRTLGYEDDLFDKFNALQIITFDECGPKSNYTYTNDEITSIYRLSKIDQAGNKLYITASVNQNASGTIGIFEIDLTDYSIAYHSISSINSIYNYEFKVLPNGNFLIYNFNSWTESEPSYSILIYDKDFTLIKEHQFTYSYYAISGNCFPFSEGYICSHGFTLIRLDNNLDVIWTKETIERDVYWQMEKVDDGFIVRTARYINFIRKMCLTKFDFDGNIIWRTPDLAKDDFSTSTSTTSKYQFRLDGNIDMIVTINDYQNEVSRMYWYVIASSNGSILEKNEIKPTQIDYAYIFNDFIQLADGTNQILLKLYSDDSYYIININEINANCIEKLPSDIGNEIAVTINDIPKNERRYKTFSIENSMWYKIEESVAFDKSCEWQFPFEEFLADDTIACQEILYTADLTNSPLDIEWNDGDTNKVKTFAKAGVYSYSTAYCDQEFDEEMRLDYEECTCNFNLANAISPNGDNVNDYFEINEPCIYASSFQINIFDRWGTQVLSTKNIDFQWDGKYNGKTVSSGVYTYVIKYNNSFKNNAVETKTGNITILY